MSYRFTRTKNKLVEYYGRLDIISTEDEELRDGEKWDYIDIVYHGTDVGLQYIHVPRKEYTRGLGIMESYCMGYDQAIKDIEEEKK